MCSWRESTQLTGISSKADVRTPANCIFDKFVKVMGNRRWGTDEKYPNVSESARVYRWATFVPQSNKRFVVIQTRLELCSKWQTGHHFSEVLAFRIAGTTRTHFHFGEPSDPALKQKFRMSQESG